MRSGVILIHVALIFMFAAALSDRLPKAQKYIAFIGTYTDSESKGIYAFRFDAADGSLTPLGLSIETANPSYLSIHPNNKFLYAVNELDSFDGKNNNGGVSAFAIDSTNGKLTLLNQQSTRGGSPCHLTLDAKGTRVLIANYNGGSVASLGVNPDGSLGPIDSFWQHSGSSVDHDRQTGPHAHGIYLDSTNRFAAVADLGLDKILVYRFDDHRGFLSPNNPYLVSVKAGAGPRHFAFHPSGRFAYANNELNSTVSVFTWNAESGGLKEIQTVSTLPVGFKGSNSTAELELHPNGKFLYVSNRGNDSVAVFAIDQSTGKLTEVQIQSTGGRTPRGFKIDPTGRFLIAGNQESNTLTVFALDQQTGRLAPTGVTTSVGKPVCVEFLPLK